MKCPGTQLPYDSCICDGCGFFKKLTERIVEKNRQTFRELLEEAFPDVKAKRLAKGKTDIGDA